MEHTPLTDYTKFPEIKVIDFPSVELAKEAERRWNVHDDLVAALGGLLAIVGDSNGVDGYHLNGDLATWDEFEEIEIAETALKNATKEGE